MENNYQFCSAAFVSTALEVIELRATPIELRRMCLRMRPLDNLHVTAAYWTDLIPEEYQQKVESHVGKSMTFPAFSDVRHPLILPLL